MTKMGNATTKNGGRSIRAIRRNNGSGNHHPIVIHLLLRECDRKLERQSSVGIPSFPQWFVRRTHDIYFPIRVAPQRAATNDWNDTTRMIDITIEQLERCYNDDRHRDRFSIGVAVCPLENRQNGLVGPSGGRDTNDWQFYLYYFTNCIAYHQTMTSA